MKLSFHMKNSDNIIPPEQYEDEGITGMSVRLVVIPSSPTEATIWITVFPSSKEDIFNHVHQGNSNSNRIPTISVPFCGLAGSSDAKRSMTIPLGIQDPPSTILDPPLKAMAHVDCGCCGSSECPSLSLHRCLQGSHSSSLLSCQVTQGLHQLQPQLQTKILLRQEGHRASLSVPSVC